MIDMTLFITKERVREKYDKVSHLCLPPSPHTPLLTFITPNTTNIFQPTRLLSPGFLV
jgi:hypothetical protein